ncbi:MAG: type II secretion system F family protein [Magnetococcales bacterium]|nr:type II secretion system F family protein [Magnetococcales bacterium]
MMARFSYRGRIEGGAAVNGVLEGRDPDHVARQLKNRGVLPLAITELPPVQRAFRSGNPLVKGYGINDLILFSRQMSALSRSGVPLVSAFQGLIAASIKPRLKKAMVQILIDLQAGRSLSLSLADQAPIFDHFFVRMVQVGEESGRLDEAFLHIANYLENGKQTRQRLTTALRYPLFVVLTLVVALAVINYSVIPAFVQLFTKFGVELPWTTRILIATSNFSRDYLLLIIGGLGGLVALFVYSIKTVSGRLFWDRLVLRVPVVGPLIHRILLARFARIFVMGSRSGMNMVQVLSAVAETLNNGFLARRVQSIQQGVFRGESLAQAAEGSEIFTPLVLQMIAVGEQTGQIEQMMSDVAAFYEEEVDYEIQALSGIIEPILLFFLAAMVLVLTLGIFLPLWELGAGR